MPKDIALSKNEKFMWLLNATFLFLYVTLKFN